MSRSHHRTCDILLITQVVEGWGKDRWRQREAKVPFQQESVPAIMALIHLFYTRDLIASPWVLLPRRLNFQRMLLEQTDSRTNNQETIKWQNVKRKEGFLLITQEGSLQFYMKNLPQHKKSLKRKEIQLLLHLLAKIKWRKEIQVQIQKDTLILEYKSTKDTKYTWFCS